MTNPGLLAAGLVLAYLFGTIPTANIVAYMFGGADLRGVGSGTVSPWNLYQSLGMWPAILAGTFDVAKGVVAPLLVTGRPVLLGAAAGALAVVGHNWSPFLKGGGGRGLSTATGALIVTVWPGAALMCAGLVIGLLIRRVIKAMGAALCLLIPVLAVTGGVSAVLVGIIIVSPIGLKTALLKHRARADESKPAAS